MIFVICGLSTLSEGFGGVKNWFFTKLLVEKLFFLIWVTNPGVLIIKFCDSGLLVSSRFYVGPNFFVVLSSAIKS